MTREKPNIEKIRAGSIGQTPVSAICVDKWSSDCRICRPRLPTMNVSRSTPTPVEERRPQTRAKKPTRVFTDWKTKGIFWFTQQDSTANVFISASLFSRRRKRNLWPWLLRCPLEGMLNYRGACVIGISKRTNLVDKVWCLLCGVHVSFWGLLGESVFCMINSKATKKMGLTLSLLCMCVSFDVFSHTWAAI